MARTLRWLVVGTGRCGWGPRDHPPLRRQDLEQAAV